MSESNRALARRWFQEVWNDRRTETIDEILSAEAIGHMEGMETRGTADFKKVREGLLEAFPDFRIIVEDMVAEGDNVVVRWRVRGSHRGHGLGFAPSGRAADFRGMTWMRFADGKLVEGCDSWNQGELMQALQAKA